MTKQIFYKRWGNIPYLSSVLFYEIGRTLPHAILQILILSLGGNASSVLTLQIIAYLAIFFFEIPSGMLSDILLNKKIVYILSIVSMILGFSIMLVATKVSIFIFGYLFYGISQALSSGTAEIIILNKLSGNREKRRFINWRRAMSYLGALIGGGFGSFVYAYLGQRYLYLIAIGAFVISFFTSLLTENDLKERKEGDSKQLYRRLKLDIRDHLGYLKQPQYILLLLSIIITTMIFGPFFNFWQIFYSHNNIPTKYFGLIYITLQTIAILSSYINHKLKPKRWAQLLAALLSGGMFIGVILLTKKILFASLFPLFLFPLYYYTFTAENQFYLNLNNKTSGGQTSILSTIRSLMSVLVYWIIFAITNFIGEEIGSIISVTTFVVAATLCYLFQCFLSNKNNRKVTNLNSLT